MTTSLSVALAPRSIAVLGASDNPHKVGGRPIAFMKQYGFAGGIYPVNPAREEVQGVKAYPSLDALPEVPDLVVVAVGGEEGVRMVEQSAAAGVKAAVVMASGYAEAGPEGKLLQARMLDAARKAGMRLIGPNCQGLANFATGAIANFSTIFYEEPGVDGPLAIIGQSGAATQSIYALARVRGLNARYVHATGNEADVTVAELLCEVVRDPAIRVVVLYIESITRVDQLAAAAALARERGLPIIAVKGGRSASGQAAASSHTGALATEDRVVDAFFARHGIVRAVDPYEALSLAPMLMQPARPESGSLVAISNSGASCVMMADTADEFGVPLLAFDEALRARLDAALPQFASAANPIDLTGAMLTNRRLFADVLDALATESRLDLLLVAFPIAGTGYDVPGYARDLAAFARGRNVAVAVAATQASVREEFARAGLVTYGREREALQALQRLADFSAAMRVAPPPAAKRVGVALPIPPGRSGFLNEAQSLSVLGQAGISVVDHSVCATEQEALDAFRRIGAPVVVKACSSDVTHKSEHGLVALDLKTEEAVSAAFRRQSEALQRLGAANEGIIVAKMLKGGRELAIGARTDPVFGPVVMVGDGGIYLEALGDFSLLLPPFDVAAVQAALSKLRVAPLLRGVRGEAPSDTAAFAGIAVRLGDAMLEWQGEVASIDINPVKVFARGEGAFAVDALVERVRLPERSR